MRAVWTLVLVASVLLATARTHHKSLRRRAESAFAAPTAGHHHHVRSHRVRAMIPERGGLPARGQPISEPIVTASVEAPIAELDAPVARGPPSG